MHGGGVHFQVSRIRHALPALHQVVSILDLSLGLLPLPLTSLTLPEVVCEATTMMCTPLEAPFAVYVALGSGGHLQSDEADLRLLQI